MARPARPAPPPPHRWLLLLLIFLWRLRRSGTRSSISAICVPRIAHFPAEVEGGVAHDSQFRRFVCHEFFIFFRRLRRSGTRSSIPAICVPRIVHFFLHKVLKTAPAWHTNPDFTALCAKVSRRPAERQRPAGTQNPIFPLCVPKLSAARRRDRAGLAHKSRFYRFVCQN